MSRARTFADLATASEEGSLSKRNMIINGDMAVAQRATSATNKSASGYYTCDRWSYVHSGDGAVDFAQSTVVTPTEFNNALKIEVRTADGSLGATDVSGLRHYIEAQNCQKLLYGTSSAKSVTLSFHVRSKQTGTYAVNLFQDDDTRQFTKTYTINSADTFEKKTITFVGDTTGVIDVNNGKGIEITWWLRAGSTYTGGDAMSGYEAFSNGDYAVGHAVDFLSSTSNEFYLTGVQLEIGDVATPFEHESYGDNLKRCKRYFIRYNNSGNYAIGAAEDGTRGIFAFPAPDMRAAPTGTQGTLTLGGGIGSPPAVTAISSVTNSGHGLDLLLTVGSGLTAKDALRIRATDTASFLAFDAELS